MSISISGYSDTNRVPGFYFALDNSKANTASAARRVLVVGQMVSGTGTALKAEISAGAADAIAKYGDGSQCAILVQEYVATDGQGELWVLPLADDAAAVAATGSFVITGPASASGTLALYVDGQLIAVPVETGDAAATIASNVVAAAASVVNVPMTLTSTDATVTATAKNKGLAGNDLLLGINLLGTAGGQSLPAGVSVAVTQPTGGTQNPTTLASGLDALGERVYDLVAHGYSDAASLSALKAWTADRWDAMDQFYGVGVTAYRGTYGQTTAFGLTQNDPHHVVMGISSSPSSPVRWAAQIAAQAAITMRSNPATPITGLALSVMAPVEADRFILSERNTLLHDGIGTFTVDDSNVVSIERLVTTYQTNGAGVADDSYLDVETLLTAQVCLQDLRSYLATTFTGYILVADGSKIGAGMKGTTAAIIGQSCVSRYRVQCTNLWCQNPDTFAANIVAENVGGGVVKLLLPYDFANQLWVIAGSAQFVKS
ncbi:bacteriophage tail sheath protein [Ameyamaea chiangmaiensis NBRC 103196]|uniref:Phage tail sheath subtilisin-like domain-containing protein n=1 Tax=Ameyamaea chiangmaiensis TaxID=442969 RepID=A0A850P8I9_9PROT|nr:phage tail sheath subtilisin-like domain-containing protein [Ameyamaea chiangmaiensis]MBS4075469.1 phage tail sheath subtilisin-like domain-containing protein [Ameyamaea chiangmaiensis]NVN38999.1 phage tail sheath subtilisin-like domain-containing protein [Ameyamaea chiangmaiensis]GBQ69655.1 bacteriophage tail sheath protein [Ameyamaea chiangmaiensis NBRC 103196]